MPAPCTSVAHGLSSVCAYGASVQSFQAFAKNFGHLVTPSKFLPSICQIKYGGADRTSMYNLGFTDQDIDRKPLEDLWGESPYRGTAAGDSNEVVDEPKALSTR
jgi:hypothetical protein